MALRASWTWRLMRLGFRRRGFATALASLAFGVATAAILAGAALWLAGDTGRRSSLSGEGAALVAFLRDDLPVVSRDSLSAALGRLPGVARVRLLGSDEALARMRGELGDRASVLDGVEEGFLPATLEITLHAGAEGADRADAIAWRLRRMEGITDVDVLRTAADARLARAHADNRRSRMLALWSAMAASVVSLCLAALIMRAGRADAAVLTGLGFTAAAVAVPGALMGGISATVGALVGMGLNATIVRQASSAVGGVPLGAHRVATALVVFALLGMSLGWWGTRSAGRDVHELGSLG